MKTLQKYTSAFRLAMQGAMEYRANFLLGLVSGAFAVIIQFFVWTAVYGGSSSSTMFGYDYGQMVVYVIMAGILSRVMSTGFEWDIAEDIKGGGLSRFLVQPMGYFPYRVMNFFGGKLVQLSMVCLICAGLLLFLQVALGIRFQLFQIGWLIPAVLLGLMLNCLLFYCISSLAFWATELSGVFTAANVFANILSGGVFPLDVFGETAVKVFRFLPFQYVIYFPLNILNGKHTLGEIRFGLAVQCAWIFGLYLLSKVLWRFGMKKYIAVGG